MAREQAARALDRYERAEASEQVFDTLTGGKQARLQDLLLELSAETLLLLDEPTDNLALPSAEALEVGRDALDDNVLKCVTTGGWSRPPDSPVPVPRPGRRCTSGSWTSKP